MKRPKLGPFILLTTLICIIIFIVGIRYGQKVEKTNKQIDYFLSIPTTAPTVIPTIGFQTYMQPGCGVSFLYPTGFTASQEASQEAKLSNGSQTIHIVCGKKAVIDPLFALQDDKQATSEVTILNQKVPSHVTDTTISFILRSPYSGASVFVEISTPLLPLFQKSLQWKAI